MPTFNLTGPEKQIITSWLFEQFGYLDNAINNLGQSARQALEAQPGLNVLSWIRTNTMSAMSSPDDWSQCGMIWWIRISDGVNITNPNRPPERTAWRPVLTAWDASLVQNPGDTKPVSMTAEDGVVTTMPNNANRVQQRNLIAKVLAVM